METTRNTAATTGTQYEETRRTVVDAEAAAAYAEATEDAYAELMAYREEVLNDLVQRAVDSATDATYRRIVSSMSGHLAGIPFDVKGNAYTGFTRDYQRAISHIAFKAYVQGLRDSFAFPNLTDGLREQFAEGERKASGCIYDFRYVPSAPIMD